MDVKTVIKAKGLTITETAERMGVSRITLEQNIGGNPTLATLRRIADAIGCNVVDFFFDEQPDAKLLRKPKTLCPYCGKPLRIEVSIIEKKH